MELTQEQKRAVNSLVAAFKKVSDSGLQVTLQDETFYFFKRGEDLTFENCNELDSYSTTKLPMIASYGM